MLPARKGSMLKKRFLGVWSWSIYVRFSTKSGRSVKSFQPQCQTKTLNFRSQEREQGLEDHKVLSLESVQQDPCWSCHRYNSQLEKYGLWRDHFHGQEEQYFSLSGFLPYLDAHDNQRGFLNFVFVSITVAKNSDIIWCQSVTKQKFSTTVITKELS